MEKQRGGRQQLSSYTQQVLYIMWELNKYFAHLNVFGRTERWLTTIGDLCNFIFAFVFVFPGNIHKSVAHECTCLTNCMNPFVTDWTPSCSQHCVQPSKVIANLPWVKKAPLEALFSYPSAETVIGAANYMFHSFTSRIKYISQPLYHWLH